MTLHFLVSLGFSWLLIASAGQLCSPTEGVDTAGCGQETSNGAALVQAKLHFSRDAVADEVDDRLMSTGSKYYKVGNGRCRNAEGQEPSFERTYDFISKRECLNACDEDDACEAIQFRNFREDRSYCQKFNPTRSVNTTGWKSRVRPGISGPIVMTDGGSEAIECLRKVPRYVITGSCEPASKYNGLYSADGKSANGVTIWKNANNKYLYHDPDCDGQGRKPKWILDASRPSKSRHSDLDDDGSCNYRANLNSDVAQLPRGARTWKMLCNGQWTDVSLTITPEWKHLDGREGSE